MALRTNMLDLISLQAARPKYSKIPAELLQRIHATQDELAPPVSRHYARTRFPLQSFNVCDIDVV